MSVAKGDYKKVTTHSLAEMKQNREKISMLTAYDYTLAKIIDSAGIDVILVGDSASNVNDGTWKFITVVRNSGTYKYFINQNTDVTRTGKDSKTFDNNNIVIGWDYRNNSASSGFVGDIGAVYFYNTNLSNDQVTLNYNETKSRYGH